MPDWPNTGVKALWALSLMMMFSVSPVAGTTLPDPLVEAPPTAGAPQRAVLAGGCFWGMQAVFKHVKGVLSVTAGYSGGTAETARYTTVSSGTTGHAETVEITYDPARVSFGRLLKVYFSVAHDPTQFNRQGPDEGRQYRSAIFYMNEGQRRVAQAYIRQLQDGGLFPHPIVTQVVPFKAFYRAEAYHQDYAERHPDDLYIVLNDRPKVTALKRQFPLLYVP